jgi:hypothetical protein
MICKSGLAVIKTGLHQFPFGLKTNNKILL